MIFNQLFNIFFVSKWFILSTKLETNKVTLILIILYRTGVHLNI